MNGQRARSAPISQRLLDSTCDKFGLARGDKLLLYHSPPGATLLDPNEIMAAGWAVEAVTDSYKARGLLNARAFDVGLYVFGDRNATALGADIDALLSADPRVLWIALLPPARVDTEEAASLITRYFFDYHTLPPDPERLLITLGHACGMARMYRRLLVEPAPLIQEEEIIGDSCSMQTLARDIRKVASVDAPLWISGESGTGKELAARAIHRQSARARGPFIAVNCGALPASLIQAELFGHEKGSFTGAHHRRIGRFEAADGGTLFLDEIGDLPLDLQINLLRFLEEKTIERVGNNHAIPVDARIIAASHVDLGTTVEEGRFREDLYFRLNVLQLTMPRLIEREGDINLLARYFFQRFAAEKGLRTKGFSQDAFAVMCHYTWPGNVRELMNRVRRAMVMAEGPLITPGDLGFDACATESNLLTLAQIRMAAEKRAIGSALTCARGNATQAARNLGISRATLYRLMGKYGIEA